MNETEKPYKVSTKRKIYRVMIVITFFYCGIGLALYYLQGKLMFHPEPLSQNYEYKFKVPFNEVNIPMTNEINLNLVQFFPKDCTPKGVVLYFHGNRENINRYEKYVSNFTKDGYEVWIADYPGYGKSTGERTEDLMNNEAIQVYKLANSIFSADSIIVYGKSLGTGVASYIASKEKIKRLILETPYYSIPSLFSSYAPIYPTNRMSRFKFPVGEYLKSVSAPITIFHGTSDRVIFYRQASKLKKVLKPNDEFITIEDGTHNNLNDFPIFHEKLDSILK
jgi:hypothetical protein